MYIRDGELPEDLRAKAKAQINENIVDVDETPKAETHEPEIYVKPFSEYTAEDWYEKYNKPDIMDRLKVHLIDTAVIYIVFALIYYLVIPGTVFNFTTAIIVYLFCVYTNSANFITWIELFLTNGYTLGKYIYKHRLMRMDGEKLTIKDVFVRSFLIKGFCDAASCGIMNIVSIIVAYIKPYSRAVHDVAANTITLDIREYKEKPEKRVEFN